MKKRVGIFTLLIFIILNFTGCSNENRAGETVNNGSRIIQKLKQ